MTNDADTLLALGIFRAVVDTGQTAGFIHGIELALRDTSVAAEILRQFEDMADAEDLARHRSRRDDLARRADDIRGMVP